MFNLSFTRDDVKRVVWTFLMAAFGVFVALLADWFTNGGDLNWKVWAIAALAAGVSAVKNLLLADGSTLK